MTTVSVVYVQHISVCIVLRYDFDMFLFVDVVVVSVVTATVVHISHLELRELNFVVGAVVEKRICVSTPRFLSLFVSGYRYCFSSIFNGNGFSLDAFIAMGL